jgi:SPP1 gp7 family putative phage head morphogenesis protein
MLRIKEKYYLPVEKYLNQNLYETFYMPIIALIKDRYDLNIVINSVSDLIRALERGDIVFSDNQFKGKFNTRISKELKQYATFDGRTKSWKVDNLANVPSNIKATTTKISEQNKAIVNELNTFLDNTEERLQLDIDPKLTTPFESSLDDMREELGADFIELGIKMQITPEQKKVLLDDYNNNQTLNIKNWKFEEVQRLRDIVTKINTQGYSKLDLKKYIENEWEVSSNKAKFLARQETSLFLSKFRREQSKKAGIRKYQWSTSNDERVRPKGGNKNTPGNNHRMLHGKIFFYGDPPIVDTKTGRKAEPGEDFNCRCIAKPVLE